MNSNADSEDVLRVGGFYMLLDLTLTSERIHRIIPCNSLYYKSVMEFQSQE